MAKTLSKVQEEIDLLLNITEVDTQKFNSKFQSVPREMEMTIRERTNDISVNYGEVWYVNLGVNVGTELDKSRPVIIVSSDSAFNHNSKVATVVPVTTSRLMFESQFELDESNFIQKEGAFNRDKPVSGIAKVEQIRTVSKGRFYHKLGSLNEKGLAQLKDAITNHIL